jgi:hypothetical protein
LFTDTSVIFSAFFYFIFVFSTGTGLPALESWSGCHIFNHNNAKARQYWTDMCLNMTRSGVIDGCVLHHEPLVHDVTVIGYL